MWEYYYCTISSTFIIYFLIPKAYWPVSSTSWVSIVFLILMYLPLQHLWKPKGILSLISCSQKNIPLSFQGCHHRTLIYFVSESFLNTSIPTFHFIIGQPMNTTEKIHLTTLMSDMMMMMVQVDRPTEISCFFTGYEETRDQVWSNLWLVEHFYQPGMPELLDRNITILGLVKHLHLVSCSPLRKVISK